MFSCIVFTVIFYVNFSKTKKNLSCQYKEMAKHAAAVTKVPLCFRAYVQLMALGLNLNSAPCHFYVRS